MMVVMILLVPSCGRPEGPSLTMVEPEPAMTKPTVAPSPAPVQQTTPQETPESIPEEIPLYGLNPWTAWEK